jgi:NADH-quinone oxidoreductase subunit M
VIYLVLIIAVPIIAGLLVALSPASRAKEIALLGTLIPAAVYAFIACTNFEWLNAQFPFQMEGSAEWFPPLGISFSLGVDVVAMLLVGLTVLLGPICVLASHTAITHRVKTYYAWLLVLQGAMAGVFCARDVVVFYVFFEFTLVPLYILINLYGSTNRKAAATKFFLFTFTGSVITLAGLVYVAWFNASSSGAWTFDMHTLGLAARRMPPSTQAWVFWALMLGFAVKVPLFPVHTWLPLAHTEAPTAGSVVLAGVLLKLGTYGMYRFALGYTPAAAVEYAPAVAVLAIIGILYAGLICWVQTDVKKLVAYSSVSHLGFCILGLFAFTSIGITGSVLYMVNHGLSTGALFLMIGMIYERYHTRSMKELGGLAGRMPIWATFMVFFTMASVGLPGLNGFVSEFMCLLGTFQSGPAWDHSATSAGLRGELGPWFAFVAGIGMIVTAIYLLYMLGRIVWGKLDEPHAHHDDQASKLPTDLNAREIGLLLPLAVLCLVLGLYPGPVLRALEGPSKDLARMMERYGHPAHSAPDIADHPESDPDGDTALAQAPAPAPNGPETEKGATP